MLIAIIYLSIAYHTRSKVTEAIIDNVIKFLNSYYPGFRSEDQLDNGYKFLKKCFTISRIL